MEEQNFNQEPEQMSIFELPDPNQLTFDDLIEN